MDNPSLIRIHRLERYRPSCSLYLMGDILSKMSQRLFSSRTVILCVKLDSHISVLMLVSNAVCKLLERVQRLPYMADQDSDIVAGYVDAQRSASIDLMR